MNHWFPLIRPNIRALFLGGVALGGYLRFPGYREESNLESQLAVPDKSLPRQNIARFDVWGFLLPTYHGNSRLIKGIGPFKGNLKMGNASQISAAIIVHWGCFPKPWFTDSGVNKSIYLQTPLVFQYFGRTRLIHTYHG